VVGEEKPLIFFSTLESGSKKNAINFSQNESAIKKPSFPFFFRFFFSFFFSPFGAITKLGL